MHTLFKITQKKAFTLLELLVVIGIIGILISLGIASYSTAQRKARDAKRKSDLQSIQHAFEQYYSICGYQYPSALPAAGSALIATTANCPSISSNVTLMTIPADPLGSSYQCIGAGGCSATGFTICPPTLTGSKYLETENCTPANPTCCVSNQQ